MRTPYGAKFWHGAKFDEYMAKLTMCHQVWGEVHMKVLK